MPELVCKIQEDCIEILLVSTLMLASALRLRELRAQLDSQGIAVKIIVGGAPFRFDPNLWREVGADATSNTASGAIEIIKEMIGEVPFAAI